MNQHKGPSVIPRVLPYVWRHDDAQPAGLPELLRGRRHEIDRLLLEHGALLFKGFGVDSVDAFQRCTDVLPGSAADYIDGNSPRTKLTDNIYTSTEYPAELAISMHNELSYSRTWPERLYFCCVVPPATGGSTLIADSAALLRALPADLVAQFETKGVTYVRNLHGGRGATIGKSWQQTFETDDRRVVERFCRDGDIGYEWKTDGGVRLIQKRPATARHPKTGEAVWFNQVDQFHPSTNPPEVYEAIKEIYAGQPFDMPQYGCFGDGSPIPDAMLQTVREETARHTVAFPWERGDFLMIDNMLTSHGRSPFTGERRILVAMSS